MGRVDIPHSCKKGDTDGMGTDITRLCEKEG